MPRPRLTRIDGFLNRASGAKSKFALLLPRSHNIDDGSEIKIADASGDHEWTATITDASTQVVTVGRFQVLRVDVEFVSRIVPVVDGDLLVVEVTVTNSAGEEASIPEVVAVEP